MSDLRGELITLVFFLVAATVLAIQGPWDFEHPWLLGVLTLAFAITSRIGFPIDRAVAIPTQMLLMPLLILGPPALTPILVFLALSLSGLLAATISGGSRKRVLLNGGDALYSLGPATVFVLGGSPGLDVTALLIIGALASQIALDAAASWIAERWRSRGETRFPIRPFVVVWIVDTLLTPIGVAAALGSAVTIWAPLALLPLVALFALAGTERSRRQEEARQQLATVTRERTRLRAAVHRIGVVLIAGGIRRAAKLISLFALGHSLTLIIATLAGWKLSATVVDAVIALSVVYVGYLGLRGSGDRHDWRQVSSVVFGFGLIHGLGLSTRLQDLGLSSDGLLGKVIAFNIGVELGQISAIILMIGVGTLIARQLEDGHTTQRYASAALIPLGLLAGFVLAASAGSDDRTSRPVAERTGRPTATTPATTQTCAAAEHEPAVFAGGAHPGANFMEPGDTYNEVDLTHVITDGYVVVRYNPDLEASQRDEVRDLVEGSDDTILAVPDPQVAGAYAVVASRRTLTCTTPNINAATTFAAQWIADVRAGTIKP